MSDDEIKKFWTDFNNEHVEDDYPSKQSFDLSKLGKYFDEKGEQTNVKEIRAELNLLNRMVGYNGEVTNIWQWCTSNIGKQFPSWSNDDVDYYQNRIDNTVDSFNKARYAYACWTITKSDIKYANLAIQSFVQTGKRYGEINDLGVFPGKTMTMCYELALKLSLSISASSPIDPKSIFLTIFETLENQNKNEKQNAIVGWLIDLITTLGDTLLSSKYKDDKDIKTILEKTRNIAELKSKKFAGEKKFEGKEAYLKREAQIFHVLGDYDSEKRIKESIAESLIERANIMKSSGLIRSHFLEMAAKVYNDIGMTDRVKELGQTAQEAIQASFDAGEFKEVSTSFTVPTVAIADKYSEKLEGKNSDEMLSEILCDDKQFIPKLEDISGSVAALKSTYPLTHLLPRMEYDGTLPSRAVTDETKKDEIAINQQFQLESTLRLSVFSELLRRYLPSQITKNDIMSWCKKLPNIESSEVSLTEKSLCYYFSKDFFGFCHTMMPRIEQEIRTLLKRFGGSTIAYDPKDIGFDQKVLGGIIKDLEPFLDKNLYKFLEVWFTQDGYNLRNKISHGWLPDKEFNENTSDLLLFTFLRFAKV